MRFFWYSYCNLQVLCLFFWVFSPKVHISLYNVQVKIKHETAKYKSHFDHCSVAWGNCGKTLRDKLQRLQKRAARVLTNSNYDADASIFLNDLHWSGKTLKLSGNFRRLWWCINLWIALHLITCLQNSYYAATCLILITLKIMKISLLLPCHEPISTIEIGSTTAGLFCGTICPLM